MYCFPPTLRHEEFKNATITGQKAFKSEHRKSLGCVLGAYLSLRILSNLAKASTKLCCCRFCCCCVESGDVCFEVQTGVWQSCWMSALLFNLVVDWLMRRSTGDQSRGIRWPFFSTLEDVDFANDIALLSYKREITYYRDAMVFDNSSVLKIFSIHTKTQSRTAL